MDDKKKFKVLLPTNGFAAGDVVELTQAQADNYNAGEPTPRVEAVNDAPAAAGVGETPKTEGEGSGDTPPSGEAQDGTPPSSETQPPPTSDAGTGDGAGADAGAGTGEGGADAGQSA